ncbi:MAG: hypothetical protein CMJ49_09150 [Planctomycetaceae bacterium]|nr:hypothetical protein [Planctomycetaceae bacterium]
MSNYLFATVAQPNRAVVFAVDPYSGKLTQAHELPLEGTPYGACFDPSRKTFYAGYAADGQHCLAIFSINPNNAAIARIGTLTLDEAPCYFSIDNTERFLLTAYYSAGMVTVHQRNPDGTIKREPHQIVATETFAHHIRTDPSNRFAFVPHVESTNKIYQFHFDEKSGKLIPNAVPTLDAGPGQGPRHLVYHPSLDIVYADNEQECSVTVYKFDSSNGILDPLQTVSTLGPLENDESFSNAQIHIHPDGRSVYAANRGPDSLAMFSIDPASGLITSLGQIPKEGTPRPFGIDPGGNFLYCGGDNTTTITAYHIDAQGALEQRESYEIGQSTGWILPLKLD